MFTIYQARPTSRSSEPACLPRGLNVYPVYVAMSHPKCSRLSGSPQHTKHHCRPFRRRGGLISIVRLSIRNMAKQIIDPLLQWKPTDHFPGRRRHVMWPPQIARTDHKTSLVKPTVYHGYLCTPSRNWTPASPARCRLSKQGTRQPREPDRWRQPGFLAAQKEASQAISWVKPSQIAIMSMDYSYLGTY